MKPLFLDFETNKAGDFYIAGFEVEGVFEQRVLNAGLEGLARAKNLTIQDPHVFIKEIIETIHKNQYVLVAYSTAERVTINNNQKTEYSGLRYLNLRKAAKTWIQKHRKQEFNDLPPLVLNATPFDMKHQRNSLASVMRLTNFNAPSDYAPGNTTSRFNAVINGLERRGQNFNQLTAVQKGKATKALKHNTFDVKAMSVLYNVIKDQDESYLEKSIINLFD